VLPGAAISGSGEDGGGGRGAAEAGSGEDGGGGRGAAVVVSPAVVGAFEELFV